MTVLDQQQSCPVRRMDTQSRTAGRDAAGEAAARRTLRDQIARLEGELGDAVLSQWPGPGAMAAGETAMEPGTRPAAAAAEAAMDPRARATGAALIGLAELERTRDALAARAAAVRQQLDALGERQETARRAREEMLLEPERYPMARITNSDVGEPGCRDWHVRPRFGLLGMLAGWWRVVVSSGCPLPKAPRRPYKGTWSPSGATRGRRGSSRAPGVCASCSVA